MQLIIEIIYT